MPPRNAQDLPVSRIVGANVAAYRARHGWSQRTLATQTATTGKPVGFSIIRRMENAAHPDNPPVAVCIDDAASLAATFGITITRLTTPPNCPACMDQPPPGFTCNTCRTPA